MRFILRMPSEARVWCIIYKVNIWVDLVLQVDLQSKFTSPSILRDCKLATEGHNKCHRPSAESKRADVEFFFKYYFFNQNSENNTRNNFIAEILRRRPTAGRNNPFGSLGAETRVSAFTWPMCMRPGTAAVRGPHFRPPAGRMVPFGRLPAETRMTTPPARPLLPSSSFILPPGSLFPPRKTGLPTFIDLQK